MSLNPPKGRNGNYTPVLNIKVSTGHTGWPLVKPPSTENLVKIHTIKTEHKFIVWEISTQAWLLLLVCLVEGNWEKWHGMPWVLGAMETPCRVDAMEKSWQFYAMGNYGKCRLWITRTCKCRELQGNFSRNREPEEQLFETQKIVKFKLLNLYL